MDPFKSPRTAREEMAGRIETLVGQAERERIEAAGLRERADELESAAALRDSIASEYQAIMEKVDRRG